MRTRLTEHAGEEGRINSTTASTPMATIIFSCLAECRSWFRPSLQRAHADQPADGKSAPAPAHEGKDVLVVAAHEDQAHVFDEAGDQPPTIAPQRLPMPPMTAAVNALRAQHEAHVVVSLGRSSRPPSHPR